MVEIQFGIQVDMTSDAAFSRELERIIGEVIDASATTTRITGFTNTGALLVLHGTFDLTDEESLLASPVHKVEIRDSDGTVIFSASGFTGITARTFEESDLAPVIDQIESGASIRGSRYDDLLIGDRSADVLAGGSGDDSLNGLAGVDLLSGGSGNDTYIIDHAAEIDRSVADAGVDLVRSPLAYTLGKQQELLILVGRTAINGTGNERDNVLTGNSAANRLNGAAGDDSLAGLGGGDTLDGRDGDDVLDGGAGTDRLSGGAGDDVYRIDRSDEINRATADPGLDRVLIASDYVLGAQQEILTLTGSATSDGTGSAAANVINGNRAANVLKGRGGNDSLYGLAGDDSLLGETGNDLLLGADGDDVLNGGSGGDLLRGAGGDDVLGGSVGDDILYGDGATDTLEGGAGNDALHGGSGNDALDSGSGDDFLDGGAGNDAMSGGIGNDRMSGGSGADILLGGAGADVLDGGAGNDQLSGGDGNDTLMFDAADTRGTNGGGGTDTLRFDRALSVNLTTLPAGRIEDFEIVDLSNRNVTLTLDLASVLNLSPSVNTLRIDGGSLDRVLGGDGWTFESLVENEGQEYAVFLQGDARLEIDIDVAQELGYPFMSLSALNGANGFRLSGIDALDTGGSTMSVAGAGDVNGDGFDDVIIGAARAESGAAYSHGEVYVVFGKAGGFPAGSVLSVLNGTNGFRIEGTDPFDYFGTSVACAGDVNGDGLADIVIGAPNAEAADTNSAGQTYVIFGKTTGFDASLTLSALDGTNGFRIDGVTSGDFSGTSVASAGDFNGDGFDELIIGAPGFDEPGYLSVGASFVVFGNTSFESALALSALDGSNGFRLVGEDRHHVAGRDVASAGDVNGDGFDDLIIAAPYADPGGVVNAGASYVVFGAPGGQVSSLELGSLNGLNGFRIDGIDAFDVSATSVASAGDFNGDGFGDLIIGAEGADPAGKSGAGESYVVFGQAGGFASSIELESLNGANGFRLDGANSQDRSGHSVSTAGDVNADGFDDLLVGAWRADHGGSAEGESCVIFGAADGFASSLSLGLLDGANGFYLHGVRIDDGSGYTVAAAGDVNGDGFDDVIIGAPGAERDAISDAGASYVVFGRDFRNEAAFTGTPGDDTYAGDADSEIMIGGAGSDTLSGAGGNDTINGGSGDDILVGGAGRDTLVGGAGSDTFRFDSLDGTDVIMDFDGAGAVSPDVMQFDGAVFTALASGGVLDAASFVSAVAPLPADADDFVLYDTATGELFYDVDGTGSGVAIPVAVIATSPDGLSAADFVVI